MMRLTHAQCFNGTLLDYVNRLAVYPEIEKVTCPLATIGAFFASRSFDEGLWKWKIQSWVIYWQLFSSIWWFYVFAQYLLTSVKYNKNLET